MMVRRSSVFLFPERGAIIKSSVGTNGHTVNTVFLRALLFGFFPESSYPEQQSHDPGL